MIKEDSRGSGKDRFCFVAIECGDHRLPRKRCQKLNLNHGLLPYIDKHRVEKINLDRPDSRRTYNVELALVGHTDTVP